jgi:hypothetical protein
MLQLFEKSAIIKLILLTGAVVGAAAWLWMRPETMAEWARLASATISVSVMLLVALAASSVWRAVWWVIRPLNRWIFPDLNGEWSVTMDSNIAQIAKSHPQLKPAAVKANVTGTITIRQNLFGIVMIFRGDDGYSTSETTFVRLTKGKESGRFRLIYVFENETPLARPADEQRHFGAGRTEVLWVDGALKIEGYYWTNRMWRQGMNTAGTITMVPKAP